MDNRKPSAGRSTLGDMSTPREELHAMIDELPDDAAAELLTEARLIKLRLAGWPTRPKEPRPWPPPWFGSIDGPTDLSERVDEVLDAEFGRTIT